jgi:hypothetical protein
VALVAAGMVLQQGQLLRLLQAQQTQAVAAVLVFKQHK